jgi:uncharacterized RDD family membrane protein YckC
VSSTPPEEPWDRPPPPPPGGPGSYPPSGGGYPPPPPGGGYPPPPPPPGAYPGGAYPGGGYPGGGYPGGGYPGAGYGAGGKGWTPFGPAAGWWLRVGATFVDLLVLLVPNFIVDLIFGRGFGTVLSLVINVAYYVIMLTRFGQTLGNMALGTRVVDANTGGPITAGKAFVRWLSEAVLFLLFFIPGLLDILWPLWDSRNQTLHDKMAGTLVLRTS